MALPKRVRDVGGSFYKGYKLTVSAGAGDYVLNMALSDMGCAVNGILVTPDAAGAGDYFKLEHLNSAGNAVKTESNTIKDDGVIAETIYNIGKYVTQRFDFVSLEVFDTGDILRLTYTNVAGVAMSVYTTVERIR